MDTNLNFDLCLHPEQFLLPCICHKAVAIRVITLPISNWLAEGIEEDRKKNTLMLYVKSLDLSNSTFYCNSLKFQGFAGVYTQSETRFLSWFKCCWKNQVSPLLQLAPVTHLFVTERGHFMMR